MSRSKDFNEDIVLEKAMNVFWQNGYENTSLNDLLSATGLLKGSLYNAFKSKENLFLICLDKYGERSRSFHFKEPEDPQKYLINFFKRLVNEGVDKNYTKGCLIMNSCLEFADKKSPAAKKTQLLFKAVEMNLSRVVDKIEETHGLANSKNIIVNDLITAAFSIREISKFKKDKFFLKQVANNALEKLNLKV